MGTERTRELALLTIYHKRGRSEVKEFWMWVFRYGRDKFKEQVCLSSSRKCFSYASAIKSANDAAERHNIYVHGVSRIEIAAYDKIPTLEEVGYWRFT